MPQDIFLNVSEEEKAKALAWHTSLNEKDERDRITCALMTLNNHRYLATVRSVVKPTKMALIVAGSSLDTRSYDDIDLFVVPQVSLRQSLEEIPTEDIHELFAEELQAIDLPYGVIPFNYGTHSKNALQIKLELARMNRHDLKGKITTISLFHSVMHFEKPRSGRKDDLVEPEGFLGAEEIIRYNRDKGSKFAVLSRQYKPYQLEL